MKSLTVLGLVTVLGLTACGQNPAEETAPPPLGTSTLSPDARDMTLLTVGDSHAVRFAEGMELVGGDANTIVGGGFGGCGLMKEKKYKLTTYGQQQEYDANPACHDWPEKWRNQIAELRPDAVFLTSSFWDANAQVIDSSGEYLTITDEAFRTQYVEYLREGIDILSADGALVYLDSSLPYLGSDMDAAEAMRETVLDVFETAKGEGKNVALMDLYRQVCNDAGCPKVIDGIQVLDPTGHPAGDSLSRLSTWMLNTFAADLRP